MADPKQVKKSTVSRKSQKSGSTSKSSAAGKSPTTGSSSSKGSTSQSGSRSGSAPEERKLQMERVQAEFNRVQATAELSGVRSEVGSLDTSINHLPNELQRLRDRGYMHAGRLDERLHTLRSQWRRLRPRVESTLRVKENQLREEVRESEGMLRRMSLSNAASITAATAAVDGLEKQVRVTRSGVEGLYADLQQDVSAIEIELRRVDKVLDIIEASPEMQLRKGEGPLLAVEAEWEQDGEEGPDGFLVLTDQRLLFEQNEEVAKKKLFGVFATDKERVQRLVFDVPMYEVEQVKASEEGGFLGMGKDDKLDLVLGPSAPVTRARFHLKGQDSEEWAGWLQRVKSGDVDRDRHADFAGEVEEAEALADAFPAQCPACLAALPAPARGAKQTTCGFCGTIVRPTIAGR